MRKSWTDERLDAFVALTDRRFDGLEQRMDGFEQRMDGLEHRMERGFDRVDADFREMHSRFDALQRTLIQSSVLVTLALIGLIATQL